MEIEEKIELFYTDKGIEGISALELGLKQIETYDPVIEDYREHGIFLDAIYRLPIHALYGLYMAMDEQFRTFYEECDNETKDTLKNYHHEAVQIITSKINTRRKTLLDARQEFLKGDTFDTESEYSKLKRQFIEEKHMLDDVIV